MEQSKETKDRGCKGCWRWFTPKNSRQRYHDDACLHRAANRRHRRKVKRALRMLKVTK